ncbi:cytochrome c1 [Aliikangiella coralliicola]|uniref:Cytochrome c1 n=1 Tax=Aliikangiella coralliicola TaxID=2592383 RepID=A0A545UK17_9GAMM|nr:cytochrome c1 [Aliikangiella coralliicola]TQV89812.1 cytochrome c1 [Aliikangiella coralliicola]
MKKLLITISAMLSFSLSAAEAGLTFPDDKLPILNDDALIVSQQRGMQIYMNNCMGCHSLEFQRYNRAAKDLLIPEDIMIENLLFSEGKVGDLMENTMKTKAAANWFGAAPPDLSVVSRARGTHWLYNYMRGFYVDDSRPYGVNNGVFKDVGMPHVLENMQGLQAKTEKVKGLENDVLYAQADIANARKQLEEGNNTSEAEKMLKQAEKTIHDAEAAMVELAAAGEFFTIVKEGRLSPQEFDSAMADLVNFLDYVGEPIKLERERLGVWVLLFIVGFGFVAYLLKKEYWKDIH